MLAKELNVAVFDRIIVVDMSTVSSDAGFYNDPASRISRIGLPQCKRHLRVVGDLTRFQA